MVPPSMGDVANTSIEGFGARGSSDVGPVCGWRLVVPRPALPRAAAAGGRGCLTALFPQPSRQLKSCDAGLRRHHQSRGDLGVRCRRLGLRRHRRRSKLFPPRGNGGSLVLARLPIGAWSRDRHRAPMAMRQSLGVFLQRRSAASRELCLRRSRAHRRGRPQASPRHSLDSIGCSRERRLPSWNPSRGGRLCRPGELRLSRTRQSQGTRR